MSSHDYIYRIKFRKMGKWNLLPADSDSWHSEGTSRYFRKIFGFGKGTFIIQTLDDDMQHAYFPQFYIDKIYDFIRRTNEKDSKHLAKILSGFYVLRDRAKRELPKTSKINLKKLSNSKLAEVYEFNRDWAHRVTPYDQFSWIAEDYWTPILGGILNRHGLKQETKDYHKALFALTKPEEISTTLIEKREVLKQVLRIKKGLTRPGKAATGLAARFGWMPVFAYGTPWKQDHYLKELLDLARTKTEELSAQYMELKDYSKIRNREFLAAVKEYKIPARDVQKFIDFGLALDSRNEAEYLVSLCGFYLLPIYDEIARRLYVSVRQLRNLVHKEIVACLRGESDAQKILNAQGKMLGWVFDKSMRRQKYLSSPEAQKFFNYLNKSAVNLQGNNEQKGLCANIGKVRGRAKILHYPAEGGKVKSGDILITHATTVDYLPPMKRAAAFVTEVGGLTCHAAVVAREFKVPCVVSLKNATKNFKDGDLVEVDADKGIVRKVR